MNENSFNLNDFQLLDKIGEGSYGKVYKIKDRTTKIIYAAKISNVELDENSEETSIDIYQEVSILSQLNHPSVLKFIGYSPINFKHKCKPVIITEYVKNGSLEDLLKEQSNPKSIVNWNGTLKLIMLYGIANAMAYLHQHKILHRDLKPDNILIDDHLYPKIADFGLSKIIHNKRDNKNQTTDIIGSPLYMAPEIWEGKPNDESSDVYAFAMIAYEIVTGLKPFENCKILELGIKVINGIRPQFSNFHLYPYIKLIESCWSQDPNNRPSFKEIAEKLRNDTDFHFESLDQTVFQEYVKYIENNIASFKESDFDIYSNKFIDRKEALLIQKQNVKKLRNFNDYNLSFLPLKIIMKLDDNSNALVKDALNDIEKQFIVGQSFIEGLGNFPFDIQIGLEFLKKSAKNGYHKAIVYYCKMLINGKLIPKNHEKARKYANKLLNNQKSLYLLLIGQIYSKEGDLEEAKKYFTESISEGSIESIYEYGKIQLKQNTNDTHYLEIAANKGFSKAMYKYGLYLINNCKNEDDKNKGISFIKMASDKGNPKALYYISNISKEKQIEERDYLKEAALKGHPEALCKLGEKMRELCLYSENNISKANLFEIFKKSSKKGNTDAMYYLGRMYIKGDGVKIPKKKKGASYIKISAYNDNIEAMNVYSECLQKGYSKPDDEETNSNEESLKFYKKAADKGDIVAIYNYGLMLCFGLGIPINLTEGIKYIKAAANVGLIGAIYNYAYFLQNGKGVPVNKVEALKYYKIAADKGDTYAMFNYAYMLDHGEGVPIDIDEAKKYYKKAMENDCVDAMLNYGIMLSKGNEEEQKEAAKYVKMAADRENINAIRDYGIMLKEGICIKVDKQFACTYFERAAYKGDIKSMIIYAEMLEKGKEIKANKEKALEYYKMAAMKGNINALMRYCNLMSSDGNEERTKEAMEFFNKTINGVKEKMPNQSPVNHHYSNMNTLINDKNKSIEISDDILVNMYKNLADQGDVYSMFMYGKMVYSGEGIAANHKEGHRYLKMAVDNNLPEAYVYYVPILMKGDDCISEDRKKGCEYFKKAADLGNLDAMFCYGVSRKNGSQYISINKEEGVHYIKMAADKGSIRAIEYYSRMLIEGDDVPVDSVKAIHYLKMAADKGHVESMLQYAMILDAGVGIKSNENEACKYYKAAADLGDANAAYSYSLKLRNGKGIPLDIEESNKYLKMAADKGKPKAMYEYSQILHEGDNVPENKVEANRYLKMSADRGYIDAIKLYATRLSTGDEGITVNISLSCYYFKLGALKGDPVCIFLYKKLLKELNEKKQNENDEHKVDKNDNNAPSNNECNIM